MSRHSRLRFPVVPLLIALLLATAAAGCGKKGPLYLPEPPKQDGAAPS
jgi:predicted small lipoprotein YifL